MVEKTFQKEFKRMTIDEILALDTKQLESMTVDELSSCVGKLLSDSPVQTVGKDGAILLDPNNPNDREWFENDEDYDIV